MLDYSLVLFEKLVDIMKVAIPLYICFDIAGDMLWRKY